MDRALSGIIAVRHEYPPKPLICVNRKPKDLQINADGEQRVKGIRRDANVELSETPLNRVAHGAQEIEVRANRRPLFY